MKTMLRMPFGSRLYRYGAFVALPLLLMGMGSFRSPLASAVPAPPAPQPADQATYDGTIKPLLKKYCLACHTGTGGGGGVNLAAAKTVADLQKDAGTWQPAMRRLRDREMPPTGAPHPSDGDRALLVQWLDATLKATDDALLPRSPGRVLMHRLSRDEYNNTLRDLLGITYRPADDFPADGSGGGGFDNNADTLFVPPILMERLLKAADKAIASAKPKRLWGTLPANLSRTRPLAKQVIGRFATRAFRRPAQAGEVAGLLHLYDIALAHGGGTTQSSPTSDWERAVRFALKGALVAPQFLFRLERPAPAGARGDGVDGVRRLSDYELASRLSYFLWVTMPDDRLRQLAAQNRLHEPAVLQAEVRRMLADGRSRAFADSFAGQWSRARELYTTALPDTNRFNDYTPALRDAMYSETVSLFDGIVRGNESVLHLLDCDYTYLNEDLARFYGVRGITGPQMRRVYLANRLRGGLLTMGSVLIVTSYPVRSSPVLRGKWVLEQILGTPPPPPPPNVPTLSQEERPQEGLTFRQRLEKHRSNPNCAGCHSKMDPLGFGLENFDAVGRWRDKIGDVAVDASGTLPGGATFTGPVEMKRYLLTRKDDFTRNLAEKMLSYALGRGLEPYDLPTVRKITARVANDNYRSRTLVEAIVQSYPFQYRKG